MALDKKMFNLGHILNGELKVFVRIVIGSISSFFHRVSIVVSLGSKKQVGGVAAGSIVPIWAVVKNTQSIFNRPVMKNPTGNMRPDFSHTITPDNLTVSSSANASDICSPKPTRFSFVNLFPKAFRKVEGKSLLCEKLRCNVHLLNQVCFGFATFPATTMVRGHSIYNTTRSQRLNKFVLVWLVVITAVAFPTAVFSQPILRTNEMLMQTSGDNQTMISLYAQTNQTLPIIDVWLGYTNNIFQVTSTGQIKAGTNSLTSIGVQYGKGITSTDGTVTNTFPVPYTILPTVTVTQIGATNSTSNIVTALTLSGFIYKAGGPNISNMWISAGQ